MKSNATKQIRNKLSIKTKSGVLFLDKESIRYIICSGHYCYIFLSGADKGEEIRVRRSLKSFEKELKDDGFWRINNNTLVNDCFFFDICRTTRNNSTLRVKGSKDGKIESLIISNRNIHKFKPDFK